MLMQGIKAVATVSVQFDLAMLRFALCRTKPGNTHQEACCSCQTLLRRRGKAPAFTRESSVLIRWYGCSAMLRCSAPLCVDLQTCLNTLQMHLCYLGASCHHRGQLTVMAVFAVMTPQRLSTTPTVV